MTEPDFAAILARLETGESVESLLTTLAPEDEREMLKRCAAVHELDAPLFDVLREVEPALKGPSLESLVESGALEPVPGRKGSYRVPASQRAEYYDRWWKDEPEPVPLIPPALATVSGRVLDHYGDAAEIETLYHELIVAPPAALKRFQTLYRAADAAFDLARCQDLIDAVTERLALLDVDAAALCNRFRRRLRSRTMWLADWHRTSRFLPPRGSAEAVDALLRGDPGRVLVLWSTGGMGKSSHLRWLIARRCVPEDCACARIDFDEIPPLLAMREPALLLLEAAHQLDQQLPEAPFHELLATYAGQRERLFGGTAPAAELEELPERFTAVLRDLPTDKPVLIALDTLERTLLVGGPKREQTGVTPLLRQLATIVADAPAVRLVIASRYKLSERVGQFAAIFPTATELQVPGLTDAESRRYLEHHRGIDRADVVERLVELARGMPFKLELLADYIQEHADADPGELEAPAAEIGVAYVMERILRGLEPPDLRTLVCHGAVPRVLERSFAREVLGTPDALWPELKRYAGTASWVTLEPGDVDAVRLHESVQESLRAVLADHEELQLQRKASAWYERRAVEQPKYRDRWLCEAVYHRFQCEGPAAAAYWDGLIAQARAGQRPALRRELAAEVLREDYDRDGRALILPETVLRARWELAVAAMQLASEDVPERREAEWLEAEAARADVRHLVAESPASGLSRSQLALLDAGLSLHRGKLEDAQADIAVALGDSLSHEDRLWLTLTHAECAARADAGDPEPHFGPALAAAESGPRPAADRAIVLLRLARHDAQRDRYESALAACERAQESAEGAVATELALLHAELERRTGAPSRALERLAALQCREDAVAARRNIQRMHALLATARAPEALRLAEETAARFSRKLLLGSARHQAIAAEGRELRGKVRAALLDIDGATKDYEEAAARWSQLGSNESVCRCYVRGAELHLRGTGDINLVDGRLDQARRTRVKRGEDAWRRLRLVGAEAQLYKGANRRSEAAKHIDDVIAALSKHPAPPSALVDAAQRGLAFAGADAQPRYLQLLCDQLEQVTPASARLALLAPLAQCPVLTAPTALRRRLRALVPSTAEADTYAHLPAGDLALLSLRDADVERVAGHADTARRIVRAAYGTLGPGAPATVRHELLRAAVRTCDRELAAELAGKLGDAPGASALLNASLLIEAAEAVGPGTERETLLSAAWSALERDGAAVSGWLARALKLAADEAQRRGDETRARADRRRAIERYRALGDLNGAHEAARDGGVEEVAADAGGMLLPHEARVTVRLRTDELTISVRRLGHDRKVHRVAQEPPLVKELVNTRAFVGLASSPVVVRRMLDDPAALGEQLAGLLSAALGRDAERPSTPGTSFDVGLRTRDTVIRALPWELGARPLAATGIFVFRRAPRTRGLPADVRAVQAALGGLAVDGILGERTDAAIREFQAENNLGRTGFPDVATVLRLQALRTGDRAPRVVVVRPSRRLEHTAYRGSRQSGVPVDWYYELAGFKVLVLESPTGEQLQRALERQPAAILHLNLGLVDHHGTPALDLGPYAGLKGRSAAGGRLTGTALDSLLPSRGLSPLVILDATAPQSRRELITQLLLRNAFAGELVSCANVRAALATGLRHYKFQKELAETLVKVLARGGTMRELLRETQAVGEGEDGPFLPPALFARHPDLRFPAPWR